jgi:hypothetical protein
MILAIFILLQIQYIRLPNGFVKIGGLKIQVVGPYLGASAGPIHMQ